MSYNEDELNPPEWMNRNYFENVLSHIENKNEVQILDLKINPATYIGDHFLSIMFRVSITYSINNHMTKKISLIVKTKPFMEAIKKRWIDESKFFEIEMRTYDEILPEVHRLLKSIGDQTILCPKLLYSSKTPSDTLIFEDLTEIGYTAPTKLIEYDGAKIIFSKLAKLHACTMILKQNNYDFTYFDMSLFNGTLASKDVIKLIKSNLTILSELLPEWNLSEYKNKLEKFIENIEIFGKELFTPIDGDDAWNVLNHNDLHAKNMMIKTNKNGNEDVLFIDFQLSNYGSPAIDINYTTYTAIDEESRNNRKELFEIYMKELRETLEKLNYKGKIPTMDDFEYHLKKKGGVKVYGSLTTLPFICLDLVSLSSNFDDIVDVTSESSKRLRKHVYSMPEKQKLLQKYFLECVMEGHI